MDYDVTFSAKAEAHLQKLEDYLAERFSVDNAARYIERLTGFCQSFANLPHRGIKRDDLRPGIRMTGFERHVTIYFVVKDRQVVILGIYYGGKSARDLR